MTKKITISGHAVMVRISIIIVIALGVIMMITKGCGFSFRDDTDPRREWLISMTGARNNLKDLRKNGVKNLPILNLNPAKFFPSGARSFSHFRQVVTDYFAPKGKVCTSLMSNSICEKHRDEIAAKWLACGALGHYQVKLINEGHYIRGWGDSPWKGDWQDRLELIYDYLRNKDKQRQISKEVFRFKLSKEKNFRVAASCYLGKSIRKHKFRSFLREKNGGKDAQYYSMCVQICYLEHTNHIGGLKYPLSEEEMDVATFCLGEKESGYKHSPGKKAWHCPLPVNLFRRTIWFAKHRWADVKDQAGKLVVEKVIDTGSYAQEYSAIGSYMSRGGWFGGGDKGSVFFLVTLIIMFMLILSWLGRRTPIWMIVSFTSFYLLLILGEAFTIGTVSGLWGILFLVISLGLSYRWWFACGRAISLADPGQIKIAWQSNPVAPWLVTEETPDPTTIHRIPVPTTKPTPTPYARRGIPRPPPNETPTSPAPSHSVKNWRKWRL